MFDFNDFAADDATGAGPKSRNHGDMHGIGIVGQTKGNGCHKKIVGDGVQTAIQPHDDRIEETSARKTGDGSQRAANESG